VSFQLPVPHVLCTILLSGGMQHAHLPLVVSHQCCVICNRLTSVHAELPVHNVTLPALGIRTAIQQRLQSATHPARSTACQVFSEQCAPDLSCWLYAYRETCCASHCLIIGMECIRTQSKDLRLSRGKRSVAAAQLAFDGSTAQPSRKTAAIFSRSPFGKRKWQ
jgi:hypothetical protein